ncbi:MAG: hypothetical protein KAQ92_07125, partial [Candidatus Aenigmarchaeota archaeon]|nr:hypothetical protein [Candidatus Aenigmarchaeota archaeon]
WDWKFFQNPNFFYNYLINNDYTVQSLGEGTSIAFNEKIARAYYHEDDVKRKYYSAEELIKLGKKCELFKIILDEKIHIENIGFIDKNKLRKAEVDICIDKDTGVIVELSIFAQSDAKSEDEEKLHNIISWHARIGTTTASNDDIMQKGKYTFVGKAWNENEAVVVIEPYISNYMSGSAEFLNRDNTILKKIDLHWQIFIGQEKKKLIIKHDLNLEKEIKYRLCIDDYCKVIGPSIISKNYNCFKNSLDKASCEKNSDCFYDDDLCLKFECNSLLIKDKEFCESRGCHWLVREDVSDRCIAYSCRLYKNEYSCNSESEDCAWSDFGCVDKECSVYNNKDACETSSLKCVWKGFGCRDFYCSSQNNKTECHNHEECIWKLTEIKTAGDCKNKNEIDYATLPNCPYLEETDCLKEDLCLWRQNKCFFNLCGIYTNAECEENENCYWEPHGSCIYNYKNEIDN